MWGVFLIETPEAMHKVSNFADLYNVMKWGFCTFLGISNPQVTYQPLDCATMLSH